METRLQVRKKRNQSSKFSDAHEEALDFTCILEIVASMVFGVVSITSCCWQASGSVDNATTISPVSSVMIRQSLCFFHNLSSEPRSIRAYCQ